MPIFITIFVASRMFIIESPFLDRKKRIDFLEAEVCDFIEAGTYGFFDTENPSIMCFLEIGTPHAAPPNERSVYADFTATSL